MVAHAESERQWDVPSSGAFRLHRLRVSLRRSVLRQRLSLDTHVDWSTHISLPSASLELSAGGAALGDTSSDLAIRVCGFNAGRIPVTGITDDNSLSTWSRRCHFQALRRLPANHYVPCKRRIHLTRRRIDEELWAGKAPSRMLRTKLMQLSVRAEEHLDDFARSQSDSRCRSQKPTTPPREFAQGCYALRLHCLILRPRKGI